MNKYRNLLGPWSAILLPVIILAGMLVGAIFIVRPLSEKLASDQKSLDERQTKLNFLIGKVTQLERLDEELVRQRLAVVEKAIPSKKDALLGLVFVQKLANNAGVQLDSLTTSPGGIGTASASPAGTDPDKGLTYQVSISGDASSINNFMNSLAKFTFPMIMVRNVTVSYMGSSATGSFVLSMMWLPAPSSFGGQDKPVAVLNPSQEAFLEYLTREVADDTAELETAPGSGFTRTSLF